jgi:hypothetical protein
MRSFRGALLLIFLKRNLRNLLSLNEWKEVWSLLLEEGMVKLKGILIRAFLMKAVHVELG